MPAIFLLSSCTRFFACGAVLTGLPVDSVRLIRLLDELVDRRDSL